MLFPLVLIGGAAAGLYYAVTRKKMAPGAALPKPPLPPGPFTVEAMNNGVEDGYAIVIEDLGGMYDYVLEQGKALGYEVDDSAAMMLEDMASRLPKAPILGVSAGTLGDDEWPDVLQHLKATGMTFGAVQAAALAKLQELGIR